MPEWAVEAMRSCVSKAAKAAGPATSGFTQGGAFWAKQPTGPPPKSLGSPLPGAGKSAGRTVRSRPPARSPSRRERWGGKGASLQEPAEESSAGKTDPAAMLQLSLPEQVESTDPVTPRAGSRQRAILESYVQGLAPAIYAGHSFKAPPAALLPDGAAAQVLARFGHLGASQLALHSGAEEQPTGADGDHGREQPPGHGTQSVLASGHADLEAPVGARRQLEIMDRERMLAIEDQSSDGGAGSQGPEWTWQTMDE